MVKARNGPYRAVTPCSRTLDVFPSAPLTPEQVAEGPVTKYDDLAPLLRPMQLVQNKDTTAPPPPQGELPVVGLLLKAVAPSV
ncbi:MAG: hypothetical protein OXC96_09400 [Cyanobacteria bacterium MAG CAR1_bin_15]|nr:hypothetical protein [Cyanobacteria bacterium MAG CAR1_bin_15]